MREEAQIEISGYARSIGVSNLERTLAQILAEAGFPLNTRCNQRGSCKGCQIVVEDQTVLACQVRLRPGQLLHLSIPSRSLLSHRPAVVSDFQTGVPSGCDPMFAGRLGIAVDLGTTTVAMLLADLQSGKVLAKSAGLNAQVGRGDNVLARIQLCQSDPSNVGLLKDDFWERTFKPLLKGLLEQAGISREEIAGMVIAGNTTMLHLAAGVDPTPLGSVPFTPVFLDQRDFEGTAFGLPKEMRVVFLPGISAYVGADISAGATCMGVCYAEQPQFLIDVGTNGEMLLCGPQGKVACATAAGPAFEGCGLLCGMRATEGVVRKIALEHTPFAVRFETIGFPCKAPIGITGSAYVDFLAEGRRVGLLATNGRFEKEMVVAYPQHFRREENGLSFLLSPEHPELRIGEVDVALLLQAKAAIAAGIETLLNLQRIQAHEIDRLFLAGGFGLHLDIGNAIGCGLLPGFTPEQIRAVGNTSLGGAYLAMLDRSLAGEMAGISAQTIELNLDPGFEDRYLDHLSLA